MFLLICHRGEIFYIKILSSGVREKKERVRGPYGTHLRGPIRLKMDKNGQNLCILTTFGPF